MVVKKLIVVFCIFFSQLSMASQVNSTKITGVLSGPKYGNNVLIAISTKPSPSDLPDCNDNASFTYVFDASTDVGKTTLAVVLTAFTSKKEVLLSGSHTCTLFENAENLGQIWVK